MRHVERLTALAQYNRSATEAEIQAAIVEYLTVCGWLVVETSQRQRVERGMVGLPDLIAFKHERSETVTLLIECKTATGKLRTSQVEFLERVKPLLSPTLWHVEAHGIDDVIDAVGAIARAWGWTI